MTNIMKKLITLIAFLFLTSFCANAKIWRVNNNPGINNVITTLQAAHDSASAGDTIMVESSPTPHGTVVLNKKLVILGPGYFLGENKDLQADLYNANVSLVEFGYKTNSLNAIISSSAGSFISGLEVYAISIKVSGVTIHRCLVNSGVQWQNDLYSGNMSNEVLSESFIRGSVTANPYYGKSITNILVKNNIILGSLTAGVASSSLIENNVIFNGVVLENSTFRNNIIVNPNANISFTSSTYTNNLAAGTKLGSSNGNQSSVDMTTVFVADPYVSGTPAGFTSDNKWKLATGSPAIGAGLNGVDAGAFGGLTPYVLSGIPEIPSIYFLEVPTSGNNSLDVKMKVRSNK
jgi:hypothetical protein